MAIAFAFAGSALLLNFYLGAMSVLLASPYVTPGETHLAGVSGGALASALACTGADLAAAREHFSLPIRMAAAGNASSSVWAQRARLVESLTADTPPGGIERCRGRLHVGLTRVDEDDGDAATAASLDNHTPWVVSDFLDDNDDNNSNNTVADMWAAVAGSTHIVCAGATAADPAGGGAPAASYRGRTVIDGGYAVGYEDLCAALPAGTECVRVSSWQVGPHRKPSLAVVAGDDAAPETPAAAAAPATLAAAASPLRSHFHHAQLNEPAGCAPYVRGAATPPRWLAPPALAADIRPGNSANSPLPFTLEEWHAMALNAALAAPHLDTMYELGVREAARWVAARRERDDGAAVAAALVAAS